MKSGWFTTEDPNYNYTLDKDKDLNGNNRLDAINPVSIIGNGIVSDDGYTMLTDDEGLANFTIRYPIRYANWVKVRFDSMVQVNGSENIQSLNFVLPFLDEDLQIVNGEPKTPWANNASAFGAGGAQCVDSMNVDINTTDNTTQVTLTPYQTFNVNIDGFTPKKSYQGFNSLILDFDKAFAVKDRNQPLIKGSEIRVTNNGFSFKKELKIN